MVPACSLEISGPPSAPEVLASLLLLLLSLWFSRILPPVENPRHVSLKLLHLGRQKSYLHIHVPVEVMLGDEDACLKPELARQPKHPQMTQKPGECEANTSLHVQAAQAQ
jgi:hypothetical protein